MSAIEAITTLALLWTVPAGATATSAFLLRQVNRLLARAGGEGREGTAAAGQ